MVAVDDTLAQNYEVMLLHVGAWLETYGVVVDKVVVEEKKNEQV